MAAHRTGDVKLHPVSSVKSLERSREFGVCFGVSLRDSELYSADPQGL